jgi:hypothetical protein
VAGRGEFLAHDLDAHDRGRLPLDELRDLLADLHELLAAGYEPVRSTASSPPSVSASLVDRVYRTPCGKAVA